MAELALIDTLVSFTIRAKDFLAIDLKAVPQDRQNVSPGGLARPPVHLVAECAMVNGQFAGYLATGTLRRLPDEDRQAHLKSFVTEEQTLAYLEEQTDRLIEVLKGTDESTLGEPDDLMGSPPSTRFAIAQFPAIHMMYHVGQMNYIHTLSGDTAVHWWK